MKFREYSKLNLSDVNKDVLKLWEQENVFAKSIDERDGAPTFVFYEGPPSANGMPGIHHVLARTIKDIVCRYKTMNGFKVLRMAGTLTVCQWNWAWKSRSASRRKTSARRFRLTNITQPAARR